MKGIWISIVKFGFFDYRIRDLRKVLVYVIMLRV